MPQQTNLNVAPYFDDFEPVSDYHQVLFKPGYPVQARELNNLQSILQNQIEKFGQHFFQEGGKVIPGNVSYSRNYTGVQINTNFQGVPVAAYVDQLIGAKITGLTSGITAVIGEVLLAEVSERDALTLYCNYISSSTINNSTEIFGDGEDLSCNVDITSGLLGNSVITAGAPFATTLQTNSSITGSAFQVEDGVYFVSGQFIAVDQETLILDQYGTLPSYRVVFYVDEQIITPDKEIVENPNPLSPAYIVFDNYEIILKWNRSLRFALAVCTLKDKIKNELKDNFNYFFYYFFLWLRTIYQ